MRILFAAHQFFPEHYAGVEIITLGLAKELRRRGHETFVLAPKRSIPVSDLGPGEVEEYEFEGVPVRRVGRPTEGLGRPYRLDFDNGVMAERAGEYLDEIQPDVIHAEHFQGLSASVIGVFSGYDAPLVYTATDFWTVCPVVDLRRHDGTMCTGPDLPECMKCIASRYPGSRMKLVVDSVPKPVARLAEKVARTPVGEKMPVLGQVRALSERPGFIREKMRGVDHVVAYTRLMEDILERNGIGEGKVEVSPYGIDTSRIKARSPQPGPDGPLRIGFIGTLAPHKGCDILIKAVTRIENADVKLDIYGNLERFKPFIERMRETTGGDGRVNFAGPFQRERVGEVLGSLDVLVVPSRWYENQPGVILEAFASGIPVVATDLGGMSEFVHHEKNGLLFALDDAEDLSKQLTRLASEPGLLQRLRDGIGPVKTVSDDADELEALYAKLLEDRRASAVESRLS
ncbi:glycosyltransferase family 4 protein [Rubrobacter indicoceani]|uniref:glycosyltransferase family 4 protein n=1 Tax=Rubrobacter indicoceani TaxID=2051957 RepID=UPI000E5B3BFA|nr:glycosyltransferase family 4 protein [Rubrobacter indicoceani]